MIDRWIYKYRLEPGANHILVTNGAEFLSVAADPVDTLPSIWMQVANIRARSYRKFHIVITGGEVDSLWTYLGTGISGEYVWHAYEDKLYVDETV